ncbi:PREDICTED: uncharacterized protein LOC107100184 isoform X2 [Cyprinodon variegatus]|uniref:uncharacterized protein LOC107100184 isoform X2 n=1 Tax=Cyprinodon variegatus TaxID=28743 RepID=UPI00074274A7|nr:PREDICTED: uncharacterized protein LOC107100184 isoform X2 [Cyprinodon variegatus]
MCSVQPLREFIRQRLTAAAEEIFSEVEKTIIQYQEEIDRQRLLDISSQRADVPQSYVSTGAVLTEQQLCNPAEPELQGTKVELDEPEHLVIKEEWEEPEPLQLEEESGQLGVHQDKAQQNPVNEEMGHSESELNGERLLFQNSGEGGIMLVKTKIENEQNCVKIEQPSLDEFLNPASQDRSLSDRINGSSSSSRCILGASFPPSPVHGPFTGSAPEHFHHRSDDTHIQEVGSSGRYSPPSKRQKVKWMNQTAKQLVESALTKEPAGGQILQEYMQTNSLTDCSRRKLVNIIAADMSDIYGTAPPRRVRERYARGIIETFPNLRDPCSKNGYEHFYNGESGTGYLAWRLKTLQRKNTSSERRRSSCRLTGGGPTARREALFTPLVTQNEEQHKEAISFMKNSSDEAAIKNKMKTTFDYRRKMVLDKKRSSDILMEFPRFRDVKGLIDQDFILEFGEDVSSMFLDRWPIFKQKVIQQSKTLPISSDLEKLIQCAERASSEEEPEENLSSGWDSDLSSIILLLHLIPPSCQGRKRPGKVSASQAEKHLVVFLKSGRSIQEHVEAFSSATQPYLLAVGTKRSSIHEFFIVLNTQVIPCKSASSLEAFDELFKAHFVFGSVYHHTLHSMYTFIQTTIYNIDVGKVQETPRVAEIRARLLK